MIAKQLFDEITQKLSETIANSPAKDLEKNAKAMLGGALNKMELVSREEFDVQQQVLIKTRVKLSEMEARVAALEAMLNNPVSQDASDAVPTETLDAPTTQRSKKAKDKTDDKSEAVE